jgi:hypothetical protein
VAEELLEVEAIEEDAPEGEGASDLEPARPLPQRLADGGEVSPWRGEARTVAIAAAGGVVVGAATVAAVRAAARSARPARRSSRPRERVANVIASRSFLVDVHLLDR